MAVSYRGKQVDMVSLAKKYEKTIALGNAHLNGRGDILGKGGKIVKTREEQLAEYYEGNKFVEKNVNLKEDSIKEVESDIKEIKEREIKEQKARPTKRVYEDISDSEKQEIDNMKG